MIGTASTEDDILSSHEIGHAAASLILIAKSSTGSKEGGKPPPAENKKYTPKMAGCTDALCNLSR